MKRLPRTLTALALASAFASHAHARQCLVTKLTADDATAKTAFGYAVAVSGDDIVVGAPLDDPNRRNSGSAYVLHREGLHWYRQAKLTPSDAARGQYFGGRVAIDGDVVAVATPRGEFTSGGDAGATYVFERQGKQWHEAAKLLPIAPRATDYLYGFGLAVQGDWIFVGEARDPTAGTDAGAVHVYRRTAQGWEPAGRIFADDAAPGDEFGSSLAASGDTLVVGAPHQSALAPLAGAAYVFERVGDVWLQTAKVLASDGAGGDVFGVAVAIEQDTLIASGALHDALGNASGAVYAFERAGGSWSETATLVPPTLQRTSSLGYSVAVSGNTLLASAPLLGPNGTVFVYRRGPGGWTLADEQRPADAEGTHGDFFGWPLAAAGDFAVMGSRYHDQRELDAGAVYVYSLSGSLCATLTSPRELSWGKHTFTLDRGPAHAGHTYWLLGSMSGTWPGSRYQGARIPLNPDFYMAALALQPNQNIFGNNMGLLDADGRAECTLNVPLSVYTRVVGLDLDHAFVEFGPAGIEHVSNVVSLRFGKRN